MYAIGQVVMVELDQDWTPGIVESVKGHADGMVVYGVRSPYTGTLYAREAQELAEPTEVQEAAVRQDLRYLPAVGCVPVAAPKERPASGFAHMVKIEGEDLGRLLGFLAWMVEHRDAVYRVRAVLDGGLKLKVGERTWTPPMGDLDPECQVAQDRARITRLVAASNTEEGPTDWVQRLRPDTAPFGQEVAALFPVDPPA